MSAIRDPRTPDSPNAVAWWERILGIGPDVGYRWPGIARTVVILACLIGLGIAGYFQAEHLILRAQLRRLNHKLAVLEQKLEEYEAVVRFLDDPASARILESLATRAPGPVKH